MTPTQPLTKEETEEMRKKVHDAVTESSDFIGAQKIVAILMQDLPRLLSEVERLSNEVERQRGEIEDLKDRVDFDRCTVEDFTVALDMRAEKIARLESLLKEAEEMAGFVKEINPPGSMCQERATAFLSSLQKHRLDAGTRQGQEERMEK